MTTTELKQLIAQKKLHTETIGDRIGFSKNNNRWFWFERYSRDGSDFEMLFCHTYNRVNGASMRTWRQGMKARDILGICAIA